MTRPDITLHIDDQGVIREASFSDRTRAKAIGGALFDSSQSLLQPLQASGAALLFDDQVMSTGDVPGTLQIRNIGAWLDSGWFDAAATSVFSTASLGLDEARFADLRASASGVVAAPLSGSPDDYLFWFRPERVRTVTWSCP